jgi:Ase1/PRC1/MAP65 family protein
LAHLIELKRENMHVFVEAARMTLQNLWDELYFSEEQMADFTPAFTGPPLPQIASLRLCDLF